MLKESTVVTEDDELQRLAATHAALNPTRRQSRSDILTSRAIESLVTSGDRTTASLANALNQIWHTGAVTEPELERVLQQAKAAGLVLVAQDFNNEDKWQATAGAREESRQDREWAQRVVCQFEAEVIGRLDDLGVELSEKQLKKAPHHLLRALAAGCRVSEQAPKAGPEFLRPVEFDTRAVQAALLSVQPKALRSALGDLVNAAVDPDDEFANELVHMLVVGSILQGFISRARLGPADKAGFDSPPARY